MNNERSPIHKEKVETVTGLPEGHEGVLDEEEGEGQHQQQVLEVEGEGRG